MDDTAKRRADELTEKAIAAGPYEDFREGYRTRLRWLKENAPAAFDDALNHYNEILVPNIAGGADPIREWVEYGRRLGELSGKGKTVRIDETGLAHAIDAETGLLLHLPDDSAVPALVLATPRELSEAQQATIQLLVLKGFGA